MRAEAPIRYFRATAQLRSILPPPRAACTAVTPFSNGNLSANRKLLKTRWLTGRIIDEVRQLAKAVQSSRRGGRCPGRVLALTGILLPHDDDVQRAAEAVGNYVANRASYFPGI